MLRRIWWRRAAGVRRSISSEKWAFERVFIGGSFIRWREVVIATYYYCNMR